jgi:hypothetical protein
MTKNQLYFAIGIPSCLFALNFLAIRASAFWQVKRFEDLSNVSITCLSDLMT